VIEDLDDTPRDVIALCIAFQTGDLEGAGAILKSANLLLLVPAFAAFVNQRGRREAGSMDAWIDHLREMLRRRSGRDG